MDERLRLPLLPISGGSIDPGVVPAEELPAEGTEAPTGDGAAPGEEGTLADGLAAGGIEIDGKQYSVEQLREALGAHTNRAQWQQTLKQQEMGLADVRKTIELVLRKPLNRVDQEDIDSLIAFSVLNRRLNSDEGFRQRWHQTFNRLADEYEQAGLGKLEAERAAASRITKAQARGERPGGLHPENAELTALKQRQERVERWAATREVRELETFIGTNVTSTATDKAKDLTPRMRSMVEDLVIAEIAPYEDVELLRMRDDGRLAMWIGQLTDYFIKEFQGALSDHDKARLEVLKTQAADARAGKTGGVTPPLKGAPPATPAGELPAPVKGRGLTQMHKRADEMIGT